MKKEDLPIPPKEAIFYEDELVYACLASFPMTRGHVVVVWKDHKKDLHELSDDEYAHLMKVVDKARNAMLEALHIKKVYLMYLDEVEHVHWHLVPRYHQKGLNCLIHEPEELKDYSLAIKIKENLSL